MRKEIIVTEDGSHTIEIPEFNVTYHSIHGAIQESKHVFIGAGLNHCWSNSGNQELNILEMGLGTGLNALLTGLEAERQNQSVHYTAIEQFPISFNQAKTLNYGELLHGENLFQEIHACEWGRKVSISKYCTLQKEKVDLLAYSNNNLFDLIYYDAFAPGAQPELWTKHVFEKLFQMLHSKGVLVTYCSKGDVRRAMLAAGFTVKKLPGPPGKREMLRATKD